MKWLGDRYVTDHSNDRRVPGFPAWETGPLEHKDHSGTGDLVGQALLGVRRAPEFRASRTSSCYWGGFGEERAARAGGRELQAEFGP